MAYRRDHPGVVTIPTRRARGNEHIKVGRSVENVFGATVAATGEAQFSRRLLVPLRQLSGVAVHGERSRCLIEECGSLVAAVERLHLTSRHVHQITDTRD
jgi:hypothetical protein